MDWWVLKQLRAMVLDDLRELIPQGYFETTADVLKFHDGIKNHAFFSHECGWGYQAAKLGKKLFFETTANLTARQVSASEVLMNLGFLACTEAMHGVASQLSEKAKEAGVSDGNSGVVAAQLNTQHIQGFEENILGALEQYLRYLTTHEAAPFTHLLKSKSVDKIDDKGAVKHPNIHILIKRMNTALDNGDPACVLHTSASIFETMAKDIVGIDTVQNQSLGAFFDRYRRESALPLEVLDYILSVYKRRNIEPLAGHGSVKEPTILMSEAVVLAELTKAFVRIEGYLNRKTQCV